MRLYQKLTSGLMAAAAMAGTTAVAQYTPYPAANTAAPAYTQPAYAAYQPAARQPAGPQPAVQQRVAAPSTPPPFSGQAYVPGYGAQRPAYAQPTYAPPNLTQPNPTQPNPKQPYAAQPAYAPPGYTAPGYTAPATVAKPQLGVAPPVAAQPSIAGQPPAGAVAPPMNGQPPRVAMQAGSGSRELPAPTEPISPAPVASAMPAVTPGPMSAGAMNAGAMNSVVSAPHPSYGSSPAVASYPADAAGADCGCNPAPAAASWEGYMPQSDASYGCAVDSCYSAPACDVACAAPAPRRQWFAGFYGLYMGRDNPGKATSAFLVDGAPAGNYYPQPGTDVFFLTSEADVDFTGGGEVRLGSTFGCASDPCGCYSYQPFAWEVGYWGLAEDSSFGELSDDDFAGTDRIYGGINYAGLEYDRDGAGGGTYAYRPLNDYYDYQAPIDSTSTNDLRVLAVRVRQTFQVQNIELNFWRFGSPATPGLGGGAGCGSGVGGGVGSGVLRNAIAGASGCGPACGSAGCGCEPCGCAPASPPRRFFINGLAGVRYMKLDETFRNSVFFAAAADPTYPGDMPTTGAGADQVIFHDIEVDNDLVGFQLGCSMNCLVGCRWTLFADTNFGIYGNSIDAYQRVYSPGGGGTVRFVQTGNDAVVRSSKEDVSFLGEARLGVGYQITPRCRLTSAYRVIAVSGVALAPSQITTPINEAAFGHIDSNDSIVIHGFQGGVEFKY